MQIGTVGLGRMGANMVRRLMRHGHETVVYDRSSEKVESLANFTGVVTESGEARGTIQAALEETVPVELLSAALYTRFRSRQPHTFAEKMLSAMRQKFGGHLEQVQG
ncbi:MAG TPA: NAD(P)-binding domain-containing protein [Verrucomicrobiae bacterium]|nr:NAD(P)-binding domain-containing protein [Verrucomicrobiae bacterium]